jgi:hypothetical protein
VERILQSEVHTTRQKIGRRYKEFKTLKFLIKWKGYPDDESTWKPGTSLEHATESIEEFYGENPEVPALVTSGQVWRGGGAPGMDIGIQSYCSDYEPFYVTT